MKSTGKVKKTGRSIVIRAKVGVIAITVLLCILVVRLANLQLIDEADLKNKALEQYTHDITISAKRGTIFDRNNKQIAVSATVYNVIISPNDIENSEQIPLITNRLSDILDVDRADILEKCQKKESKYQIIKKFISDSEEELVRTFISENKLGEIVYLEETTKRYYPYGSLASNIMGFVGVDNNGLAGIENKYDEYLRGVDGRTVRGKDGKGNPLPFKYSSYVEAQDGLNLVTTIDYTIQSILEKHLKQAYEDNKPNGKATGIVMQVDTGEILASALYPNFDPNDYKTLSEVYETKYNEFEGTEEDKNKEYQNMLFEMWDNSSVSKTYEPGSTFKIITAAMALEEGVVKKDDNFYCSGSINVPGWGRIPCHKKSGHGSQTFSEALAHSCNPAFIEIGQKVGNELFEKYFNAFGYADKSGTDILGEANSIYFRNSSNPQFGLVELSAYSFGQTFKVTPIQHIRAVSTVANGGDLVTPHIAKALVDENNNIVKTFEFETERQVVSQETCNIIMEALVDSTKNACVSGYNVVSKTGTSQKRDTPQDDDLVSSCVAFAPAEDPQIAILVLVDEPTSNPGHEFGSLVAAPVISKVLTEVLPYLGIEPTEADTEMVTVGDYIGSDSEEAKTVIESLGVKCVIKGDGGAVTGQMPVKGSEVTDKGLVVLYTNDTAEENDVKVPNVANCSPSRANTIIINNKLNIAIKGIHNKDYTNCSVVSQSPAAGELVPPGTVITVEFRYTGYND